MCGDFLHHLLWGLAQVTQQCGDLIGGQGSRWGRKHADREESKQTNKQAIKQVRKPGRMPGSKQEHAEKQVIYVKSKVYYIRLILVHTHIGLHPVIFQCVLLCNNFYHVRKT